MKKSRSDQSGVASMLFTLIMMLVITLIVLSFGQLVRHGQREALDNHLSTEAYYAAESGVNDAAQAVSYLASKNMLVEKPTCAPVTNYTNYFTSVGRDNQISDSVSYTCLKIRTVLDNLVAKLNTSSSTILNLQTTTATPSITLSWEPDSIKDGTTSVSDCPSMGTITGDFTKFGDWECPYGILRFDLVPTGSSYTADEYAQHTMTIFAVPTRNSTNAASSVDYTLSGTPPQGKRVDAVCDDTHCTVTINQTGASSRYSLRAMMIYKNSTLTVFPSDTSKKFVNGQVLVDVTGKAQDVLRRVQVRLSQGGSKGGYPDYAISSQDSICKMFGTGPPANASAPSLFREYDDDCPAN